MGTDNSFDFSTSDASTYAGFVIRIPSGITSKELLFSVLKSAGQFPDYCGNNWDAIEEVLRNFDWVEREAIFIVHSDVPLRGDTPSLNIYLDILRGAMELWSEKAYRSRSTHVMHVVFPESERAFVTEALARMPKHSHDV